MNRKFILILSIFILTQIPILFTSLPSDENVYLLMAREVNKGAKPYEDFFYGHPHIQVYLYAGLIKLFGVNIPILKGFTLLVSLGIAYLTFKIAKEKYGEKVGLISVFLLLTSYDLLIFGSFSFGLEMSALFFLISFYYLNKNNYVSGLFYALCVMTRLHLAFLGIVLFLFSKERRKFLMGASISIVYYAFSIKIPNFVDNVFLYHSIKERFFGGWISYFKSSIHLWIFFFFSIKKIKDIKLIFIGTTYLLSLLLMPSVFEYFFILITVFLSIEGSLALAHSKSKKLLWFMVFLFIFLLVFRAIPFLYNQTKGYNEFVDYIDTLEDKPLVGQSAITSLLALKTDREISKLQIDTNFQRRAVYDFSDAIVVYDKESFTGYLFNCSLLKEISVEKEDYRVWDC